MSTAAPSRSAVALTWLDNPIILWGGAIVLAYFAAKMFLPGLYKGSKDAVGAVGNDIVNGAIGIGSGIGDILGPASTQVSSKRTAMDEIKGMFQSTDRFWSDAVDKLTT